MNLHRCIARLSVVLAVVAGLFSLSTPAAQATDEGYQRIQDRDWYIVNYEINGRQVIHVDTDHATADGFWFAVAGSSYGDPQYRRMEWVYQEYGMRCWDEFGYLAFNEWMNSYFCGFDEEAIAAAKPTLNRAQMSAECQAATGQPWLIGQDDGYRNCSSLRVAAAYHGIEVPEHVLASCAPWEDQTLTASGAPKCMYQQYDFIAHPDADQVWRPAPDECVGIPADANYIRQRYISDEANTNVPGCDGAALAPNCTAATAWHPACGGVNETGVTMQSGPGGSTTDEDAPPQFNGTGTFAGAVLVTATETVTRVQSRRVRRTEVTVSVKGEVRGRMRTVRGDAYIYMRGTGQATRSATAERHVDQVQSATCVSTVSQLAADQCATAIAQQRAEAAARASDYLLLVDQARRTAAQDAVQAARVQAFADATQARITQAARRDALKAARAEALRKLRGLR